MHLLSIKSLMFSDSFVIDDCYSILFVFYKKKKKDKKNKLMFEMKFQEIFMKQKETLIILHIYSLLYIILVSYYQFYSKFHLLSHLLL